MEECIAGYWYWGEGLEVYRVGETGQCRVWGQNGCLEMAKAE